jgi:flagellar motor switch protein FliM
MHIGEIIPIDVREHLLALVDSVPVMECNYGVFNGRYALKVERMIGHENTEMLTGGNHG